MSELKVFSSGAKSLARNPLGIIALFIVLIYGFAALTLSATSTLQTPAERMPLVWFLVLFPVIVLFTFAWLVSKHHEKLYAPSDYQSDDGFLRATPHRSRRAAEIEELQRELKSKVRETIVTSVGGSNIHTSGLESLADKVSATIESATTITVDASSFLQNPSAKFEFPIAAFETLGDLTNEIYFRLADSVQPFQYGYSWVLRKKTTGEIVKTARMITNSRPGVPIQDRRSLAEVGITPGTELLVERP